MDQVPRSSRFAQLPTKGRRERAPLDDVSTGDWGEQRPRVPKCNTG